eukprot:4251536-Amphidinium_carterae.4
MEVETGDADNDETILPRLTESTLNYIVQIDGDTEEDIKKINTLQDIDDDLQSQGGSKYRSTRTSRRRKNIKNYVND